MRISRLITIALGIAVVAACANTLPEQDRRITITPPAFKLSATGLWLEFQKDAAGARKKYWGKALELTGVVTAAETTPKPHVAFDHVEANLLDDTAPDVVKASVVGQHVTLRCFCAGLADATVRLTSCVAK
jgi:tRNA_anti-like